ncbi:Uma2 family endonuclease [Deferrisoma palaeochoriense]
MIAEPARRRFSVDEFHRMARAGIFGEDDRVELLEGEVVEMTPIGSRHAGCVRRLVHVLAGSAGDRFLLSVQDPLQLGPRTEVQPDLAILRPRDDFYASAHPQAKDALLVIEVADTSAETDRTVKVPLYAKAGVPEVWLVDLPDDRVEVYRHPEGGTYAETRTVRPGDPALPVPGTDLRLDPADLLGR